MLESAFQHVSGREQVRNLDLCRKGMKGAKRGGVRSDARYKAVGLKCHATVLPTVTAQNKLSDNPRAV